MVTESYPNMISEMGIRSTGKGSSNNYSEELGILLREKAASDQELRLLRSGSAPPTVEGSLSSDQFGVGRKEMRYNPSYIPYYYENENLNPRLPRPSLSYGGGGPYAAGDRRRMSGDGIGGGRESLFSMQPDFGLGKSDYKLEVAQQKECSSNGFIGMIRDDISNTSSGSRHPSRPASRAFENEESSESHASHYHEIESSIAKRASTLHSVKPLATHIPHVGGGMMNSLDRISINIPKSFDDLVTALSGMSLSANSMVTDVKHPNSQLEVDAHQNLFHSHSPYMNNSMQYYKPAKSPTNSLLNSGRSPSSQYLNGDGFNSPLSNCGFGGFAINPSSPAMLENQIGSANFPHFVGNIGASGMNSRAAELELHNLCRVGNISAEDALHMALMDPSYLRSHIELQKPHLEAFLPKSQYDPCFGKTRNLNHGFYGNPAFAPGMSYPGSPMGDLVIPNLPFGHAEQVMHFPSGLMNIPGSLMGGNLEESLASSLLYDFKSDKTKCFELAEIAGHVVEFSADQYGSRFIQQKLETATVQEKNMVFHEIMPHGLSLMTDVFGNYVIQKFFEHGSSSQIRQLAELLTGHVLNLSLQMYGCRVIQKAIEVIELDQQTRLVAELDGHVMRCVRDQNGNHVIQKCIECVPESVIDFIVTTFYHQIVTLSTHPYGCRVVQRILEHCHNPQTQKIVMDEILQSVCMLAQDQYGNYVIQHVLEHGKPQERSAIISQLIGKIVPMSQQKYASNVVEKCLSFGTPGERQALVNEIIGTTDENEPLQVMMKDQFANYVVQKMLETCDDQQLELILNRIKVHLSALKKYTYGKHIVARVEKLVATGEKRISGLSLSSA